MHPLIQLKTNTSLFLVAFALACFGLSPASLAQLSPPPDGGYPNNNTAEGDDALFSLTTGFTNTAVGFSALYSNTTGAGNTATGARALLSNTTGRFNSAYGSQALRDNTTGDSNTADGSGALSDNTTGVFNTATGALALNGNTEGVENTANGAFALLENTTGFDNTATGVGALSSNTEGFFNTAAGVDALANNTTGTRNTAFGRLALYNNTSGSRNIALGNFAGFNLVTGDNNIDIANDGVAAESGTIRIGTQGTQTKTFIAGISGAGVTGVAVKVNAAGQLGTAPSAARFKDGIKPMDKASEAILALKPVTFRYKKELDAEGLPQFGLVAEDVEKVNPFLVVRDKEGKPYTVHYEAVNAMLLNEFLKEHRVVQEQKTAIAQLKKELQATAVHQQKQIEALTTGLQKVSDQLELSKPVPRTVVNNQ
jgi:Chaperone of endosialidase